MEKGMRALYIEGLASHGDPELCVGVPVRAQRSVGRGCAGGVIEPRIPSEFSVPMQRLIGREACRERDLVVAMIVQRLIAPGSKLSATRRFAQTTLSDELSLGEVTELRTAGGDGLAAGASGPDRADARAAP